MAIRDDACAEIADQVRSMHALTAGNLHELLLSKWFRSLLQCVSGMPSLVNAFVLLAPPEMCELLLLIAAVGGCCVCKAALSC